MSLSRGTGVATSSPTRPGTQRTSATGCCPQRPVRQPPDRGQPALLLRGHPGPVPGRRRLARLEQALDGRGGTALDRHPGLAHVTRALDPVALERGRWRRCAAGFNQPIDAPARASSTSRCRSWPRASPTAIRAGCWRTNPGSSHGPGGGRREPPLPVLPGRRDAALELDPSGMCWPSSARCGSSRLARHRHSGLFGPRQASPTPASTTSSCTTSRSSSPLFSATGRSSPWKGSPMRRSGPGISC